MNNIYIPCKDAAAWKPLLAQPKKHWRSGYSAKTLAHSWSEAKGFPEEVRKALITSTCFRDIELLHAIPEHKVALQGGIRASQNDVWALARAGGDLVSITVEGKVDEPFDKTVKDWLAHPTPGKRGRLKFLAGTLGIDVSQLNGIRYQLLHRTASAIIEAERYSAKHAVMLIHSFSDSQKHLDDFTKFVELFGHHVTVNRVATVGTRRGVTLHFVWVTGDLQYLSR